MTVRVLVSAAFAVCLVAGPAAAERFTADKILFEDVTGSVEIVAHSGDELDVQIRQGATHRQIGVSFDEGVVVVKGERWKEEETKDCCNDRIRRTFHPRHGREMSDGAAADEGFFAGYPTIVVSMPRRGDVSFIDARVKLKMETIDGALNLGACFVYGETGDVGEAVVGVVAGSRLVMGDVGAGLEIDVSGDADVRAGKAASVDVDIAGPGDVILGDIDGMLDVSIAGSGAVRANSLNGPLTVRIAGSGGVGVRSGRADRLRAVMDGSGLVVFGGSAVQPDLRLFGSAEVRLASVTGRMTRAGGGRVYVGGELVEKN